MARSNGAMNPVEVDHAAEQVCERLAVQQRNRFRTAQSAADKRSYAL
jgi:hypothetical protein